MKKKDYKAAHQKSSLYKGLQSYCSIRHNIIISPNNEVGALEWDTGLLINNRHCSTKIIKENERHITTIPKQCANGCLYPVY